MSENKIIKNLIAMVLSVIMVVGMIPVSATAETGRLFLGASVEISAFETLMEDIAVQSVPLGTSQSDLVLPDILTVTVRSVTSVGDTLLDFDEALPESGRVKVVSGPAIDGDSARVITVSIPVKWVSSPEYDCEMSGTYIFAPVLPEGYDLVDEVEVPQITVTVGLDMLLALTSTAADYSWYDTNPAAAEFNISSVPQLEGLANIVKGNHGPAFDFLGKTIKLAANLNLSGYDSWTPIGTIDNPFSGTFDGNFYTISNMTINSTGANYVGLFGNVTGSVSNLVLSNVNVTGNENVGAVAGQSLGSIVNCAVVGGTVKGYGRIGGVVGRSEGPIESSFSTCNVVGTGAYGSYHVGGIVGSLYNRLMNCYTTGKVSGTGQFFQQVGGIAGSAGNGSSIQNVFATGAVSGNMNVGGIVGTVSGYFDMFGMGISIVKNNAALNSSVSADSDIGRVVGKASDYTDVADNIAYAHMVNSVSDGTSKTLPDINQTGFFTANGFATSAWLCQDSKLPILTAFPAGLQTGNFPTHLAYTTPSMPQNVKATSGNAQVTLSWSAPTIPGSSYITGYEVNKESGSWVWVGMNTSYTFTGLTNGTSYTVWVRAVNNMGGGAQVPVTIAPGITPSAPRNLKVTKAEYGEVTLTWDTPTSVGTGPITNYQYRTTINTTSGEWKTVAGTTVTISGLGNGSQYIFDVRAVNSYGEGASTQVTAIPKGKPLPPRYLEAQTSSEQVTLVWYAPILDGGSAITGYEVYNPVTGKWETTDLTTYTITGLDNGKLYSFSVVSVNAMGKSGGVSVTATPRQAPAIISENSVTLVYGDGGTYQVVTNGTTPITYSLKNQPSGVTINSSTGILTIPKTIAVGTYPFTITASNGQSPNATQAFTLVINRRVPALSDLVYSPLDNVVYNGMPQEIGTVLDRYSIGMDFTVYYSGTVGTVYAKSTTPPINTGDYQVTASIAENPNFMAAELILVNFSIERKAILVTPTIGQKKEYGQDDPVLNYSLSTPLVSDDAMTGSLTRVAGENVGDYEILLGSLSGGSNYTLTLSSSNFTITPKSSVALTIAEIPPQTYNGSAFTPEPEVRDDSVVLVKGIDFTYDYENNVDAGVATVTISGTGNYAGSTGSSAFTINKAENLFRISCANITYGETPTPTADINISGGTVFYEYKNQGADDSTYSPTVPTAAGSYTVRGISMTTVNYNEANSTVDFRINKLVPSLTLETDPADNQTRPGSVSLLAVLPADATGSLTYKAGLDTITTVTLPANIVSFTPTDSLNTYDFTVEYSGDSKYEGMTSSSLTYSFTKSNQAELVVADGMVSYGDGLDLSHLVSGGSGTGRLNFALTDGPGVIDGTILTPTGIGEVNLIVTKAADYDYNTKSTRLKVTIYPRIITFSVAPVESQTYTGSSVTPTPEVRDGDIILTVGEHFTCSYLDNTDVGDATINISGIGNYEGSIGSITFRIANRSSHNDDSNSRNNEIVSVIKPNQPTVATLTATAQVINRNATLTITERMINEAIKKALADAKDKGNTTNGIRVDISVTATSATGFTLILERAALNRLLDAEVKSFHVYNLAVNMIFDTEALKQIQAQSEDNVCITANPIKITGLRSVFDITIGSTKNGKTVNITSLGKGVSTLGIPVKLSKNEFSGYLYGASVGTDKKVSRIANSVYDVNSGCLTFTTNHFSVYGVGYTSPSTKFTDINTHWAKESIDYVVGRELLSGTSKTTFSPNAIMTRGMLVTALGRLAGVDLKVYNTNSFTDMKEDSSFRPYIEWAYKKGIVPITGCTSFEPDRAVTRQEMAVIFINYAKATGYTLPFTREAITYADASSIANTCKTAVADMQQAGVIMGKSDNKFNPEASTTRAEVSAMLHRFIKLTINPSTAQGWAKNDAGQYLYYKDGKVLTGTQIIGDTKYFFKTDGVLNIGWVKDDTGNWYYFYADGSLARKTVVDDYEVDENGVRKTK